MNFSYLKELNKEQKQAVTTINGPLLIIAGAGSGKTTVLVNRVAYMIDNGINPEEILLLTFTNNAARNMINRAKNLAGSKCNKVTACTYHSFCTKLLRKHGWRINIEKDFTIIDSCQAQDIIKIIKSEDEKEYDVKNFPPNSDIISIYSNSINLNMTLENIIYERYKDYEDNMFLIIKLIKKYNQYKKEKNILDYDDLLIKTNELLSIGRMLTEVNDRYKYIMVDEYQDTNDLQEDILMKLCKKNKNIAVVGDDYQSIYGFRGSNVNNILYFPQKFKNCKQILINTNYRSTQQIINIANNVMDNYAKFGYPKQMKSNNKKGNLTKLIQPANESSQSKLIIDEIKKCLKNNLSLNDIAILERNSKTSSDLELLLNKEGIPFRKLGGLKLLEHRCVLDVLSYFRVLINTKDELAWFRIVDNIPGIGTAYSNKIVINNTDKPNFLTNNNFQNNSFYPYLQILENRIEQIKKESSYYNQIDLILDYYTYIRQEYIKKMKTKDAGEITKANKELDNDIETLNILKDFMLKSSSVTDFLDFITLETNPQIEDEDDMLTISTIHSAKGLEWDTVFLLNCVDGVFPKYTENKRNSNADSCYNEELRCFYVALTRAKNQLFIMSPQFIKAKGKIIETQPSHLLNKACSELEYLKEDAKIIYLNVPFQYREIAKQNGALFDWTQKKWYILYTADTDMSIIRKWVI